MKKLILPVIAILMIVAISGCIGGEDEVVTVRGYGLEITNFTSNVGEIYSSQTTHVIMKVENHGEAKINKENGLVLLIIPNDWTLSQDKDQAYKKDINFEDEIRGTAAGSDFFRWTIQAPALTKGLERPDTITGRIYYDYETAAIGNIWVYPESELLAEREQGNELEALRYETTRGPIDIDINVLPDPVSVYSDGEIFTLTITLTNQGGGIVYENGIITDDVSTLSLLDDYRNKVTLRVDIPDLTVVDATCDDDVEFFGTSAIAICDIKVDTVPSTRQSYPITVTAYYGYYTDRDISITTIGREEALQCEVDADCPTGYDCINAKCVKEAVTPVDYKLDAEITLVSTGTTTAPASAETVKYCPTSKLGEQYEFSISDVSSDSAKFTIKEMVDEGEASSIINEGSSWTYDGTRSQISIKNEKVDSDNKEIDVTITIDNEKVAITDYRFISTSDTATLNYDGTSYTVALNGFMVDGEADLGEDEVVTYPEKLDTASFTFSGSDISDATLEIYRNKLGQCVDTVPLGSDVYAGIGIDNSATASSASAGTIETFIAIGTRAAVEEAITNGFYKDNCATLEELTFASGCFVQE